MISSEKLERNKRDVEIYRSTPRILPDKIICDKTPRDCDTCWLRFRCWTSIVVHSWSGIDLAKELSRREQVH